MSQTSHNNETAPIEYSLNSVPLHRRMLALEEHALRGKIPLSIKLGIPQSIINVMVTDIERISDIIDNSYDVLNTVRSNLKEKGHSPYVQQQNKDYFNRWRYPAIVFGLPHLNKQIFHKKIASLFMRESKRQVNVHTTLLELFQAKKTIVHSKQPEQRSFMTEMEVIKGTSLPLIYFSPAGIWNRLFKAHSTEAISGLIAEELSHYMLRLVHIFVHGERALPFHAELLQHIDRQKCHEARISEQHARPESTTSSFEAAKLGTIMHDVAINGAVDNIDALLFHDNYQEDTYTASHIFAANYMHFLQVLYHHNREEGQSLERRFYYASNKDKLLMLLEEIPTYIKAHSLPATWPVEKHDATVMWYVPVGQKFITLMNTTLKLAGIEAMEHVSCADIRGKRYKDSLHVFRETNKLPLPTTDMPYYFWKTTEEVTDSAPSNT